MEDLFSVRQNFEDPLSHLLFNFQRFKGTKLTKPFSHLVKLGVIVMADGCFVAPVTDIVVADVIVAAAAITNNNISVVDFVGRDVAADDNGIESVKRVK